MPCYYPQTGKLAIGKEFYAFIDKVALNDNFFVGGDFNGHVGCDVGSFGKVLRVFVIGQVNDWEITLMDSWKSVTFDEFLFQDREKSTSKKSKSQFKLNDIDTVTDYILGKNR